MCHVLPFACHLSPVTNANSHSHSHQKKNQRVNIVEMAEKTQIKTHRALAILAIHILTISLQSTRKWVFRDGTDTQHVDIAT